VKAWLEQASRRLAEAWPFRESFGGLLSFSFLVQYAERRLTRGTEPDKIHGRVFERRPLLRFRKYCAAGRSGSVQSFFGGSPAQRAAPSITPLVNTLETFSTCLVALTNTPPPVISWVALREESALENLLTLPTEYVSPGNPCGPIRPNLTPLPDDSSLRQTGPI
jgi:hypothetical protein